MKAGKKMGKELKKNLFNIILVIFASVFFVLFVIIELYIKISLKKDCTYKTTAVVSDIIKEKNEEDHNFGGYICTPVFTFTYEGTEYNVISVYPSNHVKVSLNEEVRFYIDPADPNRYYCPAEKGITTYVIVFSLFGVGFALCLLGVFKQYRTQRKFDKFLELKKSLDI